VARIETLPISLIRMTDDWQHRVDAVWADAAKLTDDELVARIDALAAERDPGDATALAERGEDFKAGPVQPGLDGADRPVEGAGDVVVALALLME